MSGSRAAVSGPLSAAAVYPGGPTCPGTAEVMIALRSDSRANITAGSGRRGVPSVVSILEPDPDLAEDLSDEDLAIARRHLVTGVEGYPRGTWIVSPDDFDPVANLGLLIVKGLLAAGHDRRAHLRRAPRTGRRAATMAADRPRSVGCRGGRLGSAAVAALGRLPARIRPRGDLRRAAVHQAGLSRFDGKTWRELKGAIGG